MENQYEAMKQQAIEDCKAGRFVEAEQSLSHLIRVLRQHGAPLATSPTMYWYLVAQHKGDERKAVDEFLKLKD